MESLVEPGGRGLEDAGDARVAKTLDPREVNGRIGSCKYSANRRGLAVWGQQRIRIIQFKVPRKKASRENEN